MADQAENHDHADRAPDGDESAVIMDGLRAYNERRRDSGTDVRSPSSLAIRNGEGRRRPTRPHVARPLDGRAIFPAGGLEARPIW